MSAFCPACSLKHICLSVPLSHPLVQDSGLVAGLFSSTSCCIPTVCTVILSSLPLFCSQMAGLLHGNEPQTFGRTDTPDMKEIQPQVRSASWQGDLRSRQTLIFLAFWLTVLFCNYLLDRPAGFMPALAPLHEQGQKQVYCLFLSGEKALSCFYSFPC